MLSFPFTILHVWSASFSWDGKERNCFPIQPRGGGEAESNRHQKEGGLTSQLMLWGDIYRPLLAKYLNEVQWERKTLPAAANAIFFPPTRKRTHFKTREMGKGGRAFLECGGRQKNFTFAMFQVAEFSLVYSGVMVVSGGLLDCNLARFELFPVSFSSLKKIKV